MQHVTALPLREPSFQPDTVYLDTPTYGLASQRVVEVMGEALERWRSGRATTAEYDEAVDRSRQLMADCMGTAPDRVAVANQVSVFVGLVAASLPDGSRVLAPDNDFTSLLFPFLAQEQRGITVRTVPLEALADSVDPSVDVVAFSLVQSSDGTVADVDAIEEAARHHGARLVVDVTQAAGWLPFEPDRFDVTVFSAYKWLLCPRGTAFMILGQDPPELRPLFAGWYAGEDVWDSIYGPPLRLATSARRYDVSPAWLSWVGSVPALEMIADAGIEAIHRHDTGLAAVARQSLGLPPHPSAIVRIESDTELDLAGHNISSAHRAGSIRVGFHLYNDLSDVDALIDAIGREQS